jgi:C-terminal processing protease CtpA/Prc
MAALPLGSPIRLIVGVAGIEARVSRDTRDNSFGFALRGHRPTFISSLRRGGPADCAGLKIGDQIWELDSKPVFEMPLEEVRVLT